jgi:uncharacterized membrane protein YeaQ/YmgE (transglycosylase-associated protein family)
MWWNLVVFTLIGVFAGGSARVFYASRQPMNILGTVVLGMVGAVLGGLLSWTIWPAAVGDIHTGALLLSLLGALVTLVTWPIVARARSRQTVAQTPIP